LEHGLKFFKLEGDPLFQRERRPQPQLVYIYIFAVMSWLSATFFGISRMEFSRHPAFARSQGASLSVDLAQVGFIIL
jgi:hypothetical protein